MTDSASQARLIARQGKSLDYEQMALDAIQRSWELDDRECQALALADAQAWATLHLARVTKKRTVNRRRRGRPRRKEKA